MMSKLHPRIGVPDDVSIGVRGRLNLVSVSGSGADRGVVQKVVVEKSYMKERPREKKRYTKSAAHKSVIEKSAGSSCIKSAIRNTFLPRFKNLSEIISCFRFQPQGT